MNFDKKYGVCSAVAEVLTELCPTPMKRIGTRDYLSEVGEQKFLPNKFGKTSGYIAPAAKEVISRRELKFKLIL